MAARLKRLNDQVMVITGASSGIGLATALNAASHGAKVVLAARSDATLTEVVDRIHGFGGEAVAVPCDIVEAAQVVAVAQTAVERFGRIDTWVNNAGLGMYGRADETNEADARKLFDVNFWGVVNGCMAALPHLRQAGGGALITVGSEVSENYSPLTAIYGASKNAVKGYIDVLRVEIEEIDMAPISVTLIQPTTVDTPFPQHARNYMYLEARIPDPKADPLDVAAAILHSAVIPTREKKVGGMSMLDAAMSKLLPGLADRISAGRVKDQHYNEPPRNPAGAMDRSSEATGVAGQMRGPGALARR